MHALLFPQLHFFSFPYICVICLCFGQNEPCHKPCLMTTILCLIKLTFALFFLPHLVVLFSYFLVHTRMLFVYLSLFLFMQITSRIDLGKEDDNTSCEEGERGGGGTLFVDDDGCPHEKLKQHHFCSSSTLDDDEDDDYREVSTDERVDDDGKSDGDYDGEEDEDIDIRRNDRIRTGKIHHHGRLSSSGAVIRGKRRGMMFEPPCHHHHRQVRDLCQRHDDNPQRRLQYDKPTSNDPSTRRRVENENILDNDDGDIHNHCDDAEPQKDREAERQDDNNQSERTTTPTSGKTVVVTSSSHSEENLTESLNLPQTKGGKGTTMSPTSSLPCRPHPRPRKGVMGNNVYAPSSKVSSKGWLRQNVDQETQEVYFGYNATNDKVCRKCCSL